MQTRTEILARGDNLFQRQMTGGKKPTTGPRSHAKLDWGDPLRWVELGLSELIWAHYSELERRTDDRAHCVRRFPAPFNPSKVIAEIVELLRD